MEFAPNPPRGGSDDDISRRIGNVLVFGGANMIARLDSIRSGHPFYSFNGLQSAASQSINPSV